MGFYTRFKEPNARAEIVRYYNFMGKHDDVFRGNRPHAEAVLLFPRAKVHAGEVAPVEAFKKLGRRLLDEHVLFDVKPDDLPKAELDQVLARYPVVLSAASDEAAIEKLIASTARSRFTVPKTVRVSASRPAQGDALDLHFVNYNREEPAKKMSPGTGLLDEKPIAVEEVLVELALPAGYSAASARALTPEEAEPREVKLEAADGRVRLRVPKFLVYSVVRLDLKRAP